MTMAIKDSTKPPVSVHGNQGAKVTGIEPDLEIRFSPLYAWLLIGFGGIFFFLGLLFTSPLARGRNVGVGLFLCLASVAAILGGNYWRHHLHVVVRMTTRQLFLPRGVVVDWTNIIAIEKKALTLPNHGVFHSSEYVLFKLKNKLPAKNSYERFGLKLKSAVLGRYDLVISPQQELMRDADWFIAECKKRMPPGLPSS